MKNNDVRFKLNFRFYLCGMILLALSFFILYSMYSLATREILMGDTNEAISIPEKGIFLTLLGLVGFSWLVSTFTVWRQIFRGGTAFKLGTDGIENAITSFMLFAFVFVIPIKLIPWDAIKSISPYETGYKAEIDIQTVKAGWFAKKILQKRGFHFCRHYTKFDKSEIDKYYPVNKESDAVSPDLSSLK